MAINRNLFFVAILIYICFVYAILYVYPAAHLIKIVSLPLLILPGLSLASLLSRGTFFGWSQVFTVLVSLLLSLALYGLTAYATISPGFIYRDIIRTFFVINMIAVALIYFVPIQKPRTFHVAFPRFRLSATHLIILFPVFLLLLSWMIYPFFPGDDTYAYNYTLDLSIRGHTIVQSFLARRPAFTPFLVMLHEITGFSSNLLLARVLPLFSVLSLMLLPLYGYMRNRDSKWSALILCYLFLGSPFFLFQAMYSNPQIMVISLAFPVLLLCTESLRLTDARLLLLAFVMSIAASLFHELGFSLLAVSAISGAPLYIRALRRNLKSTLQRTAIALVILYPYWLLLEPAQQYAKVSWIFQAVTDALSRGVRWHWWYVNHYTGPDGISFSYPGWSGVVWYAYLGVFVLIAILVMFLLMRKSIRKYSLILLPSGIFAILFLFMAEIYPRIVVQPFLPERAWTFLIVGITTALSVLAANVAGTALPRMVQLLACLAIVMGVAGFLYTTYNRGILLAKQEKKAIEVLRQTPAHSIILSNQLHSASIAHFVPRKFVEFHLEDPANLDQEINQKLRSLDIRNFTKREFVTVTDAQGSVVSRTEQVYVIGDVFAQLQYIDSGDKPPAYYYYSGYRFDKTQFLGSKKYFTANNQALSDRIFQTFQDKSLVHDPKIILVKVQ